jgi:hypothetical protein
MDESRFSLRETVSLEKPGTPPAPAAAPLSALARIMWDQGVPQTGAKSAKEEAIGLLQVAAEVEHALLVQYFYSAYSLNPAVSQAADAQAQIIEVANKRRPI